MASRDVPIDCTVWVAFLNTLIIPKRDKLAPNADSTLGGFTLVDARLRPMA